MKSNTKIIIKNDSDSLSPSNSFENFSAKLQKERNEKITKEQELQEKEYKKELKGEAKTAGKVLGGMIATLGAPFAVMALLDSKSKIKSIAKRAEVKMSERQVIDCSDIEHTQSATRFIKSLATNKRYTLQFPNLSDHGIKSIINNLKRYSLVDLVLSFDHAPRQNRTGFFRIFADRIAGNRMAHRIQSVVESLGKIKYKHGLEVNFRNHHISDRDALKILAAIQANAKNLKNVTINLEGSLSAKMQQRFKLLTANIANVKVIVNASQRVNIAVEQTRTKRKEKAVNSSTLFKPKNTANVETTTSKIPSKSVGELKQ